MLPPVSPMRSPRSGPLHPTAALPATTCKGEAAKAAGEDSGAPPRGRGRSLEALAPGSPQKAASWETTGRYEDGDAGQAPPRTAKAVRLWLSARAADPADPSASEGDGGGARRVASAEGWPRGRREAEDALPGRAVAVVVREAVTCAGHWTAVDVDEKRLRFAAGLFAASSEGGAGEVFKAVDSHLRVGRVDRACVVLRGAARGFRQGVARCLAAARRPANAARTTVPPEAWYCLLEGLVHLRRLAVRVFEDEALALSLHPHFVEYAVAELVGPDFSAEIAAVAGRDCDVPASWTDRLPGGVLDADAVGRLAARKRADGAHDFANALERGAGGD